MGCMPYTNTNSKNLFSNVESKLVGVILPTGGRMKKVKARPNFHIACIGGSAGGP
jgi:hypothetical protein